MHIQWSEFILPAEKATITWMRVTLSNRGIISLNRAAYRAMAQPERVVLLFDPVNYLIGLRPAGSNVKHAMRIRLRRETNANYRICAKNFCNYYQIRLKHSLKFNDILTQDDGTLILDLRTTTEIARAKSGSQMQLSLR